MKTLFAIKTLLFAFLLVIGTGVQAQSTGGSNPGSNDLTVYARTVGDLASFEVEIPQPGRYVVTWDFGDGTSVTAPDATYEHIYRSTGTFLVTVTVTMTGTGTVHEGFAYVTLE